MSIQRKAFSALKWAAAAKVLVQTASWAATLVIVGLATALLGRDFMLRRERQ